jgi:uncharacterized membrane protein YkoI
MYLLLPRAAVLALILGLPSLGPAVAQDRAVPPQPAEDASQQLQADIARVEGLKVTLRAAIAAAERASRGKAMDASIEVENGKPVYRILSVAAGKIWEGTIDADSAAVVGDVKTVDTTSLDPDDQDEIAALQSARISLAEAVEAAEKKIGGRAMDAGLEAQNGKIVYVAEILKERDMHRVSIDPETGEAVAMSVDSLLPETGSTVGPEDDSQR